MTITKFATALSISVAAVYAQDPTKYGLQWDNFNVDRQVRLEDTDGKRITMSRSVSDWTLQRLDMSGWFLKPQTPMDGCYEKATRFPEEEYRKNWWEIQAEKEQTEDEIRFRMDQAFVYKDCRSAIEQKFIRERLRVKLPEATLDSELLTQEEYENPIQASSELDQEAIDLYAQASDLQLELNEINAEYARLVAEVNGAKR